MAWGRQGEWFCEECTARGRHPRPLQPPTLAKPQKGKARRPSVQEKAGKQKAHDSNLQKRPPAVMVPRVHMAAPAQRAVSGARRERNSNKHKRLFLPNEPGGLTVSLS
jgi:hypothetical protein